MKERYVIHMRDGFKNGSYYLTEDKALFEEAGAIEEDETLIEFMNDNEHKFEIVDELAGVSVIEDFTGVFY
jgi:hypothetical protein